MTLHSEAREETKHGHPIASPAGLTCCCCCVQTTGAASRDRDGDDGSCDENDVVGDHRDISRVGRSDTVIEFPGMRIADLVGNILRHYGTKMRINMVYPFPGLTMTDIRKAE